MPANDTVGYDHAEIDEAVRKINELAERAENECKEKALAMKKKVEEETARNTRGGPAPIYADFIDAVNTSCDQIIAKSKAIADNYRSIADTLTKANQDARSVADDAASAADRTSTDV